MGLLSFYLLFINDMTIGKWLLNTRCVSVFCIPLCKTFLTIRRIKRDIIQIYMGLNIRYTLLLSYFNGT
jgi:hypothetical protein